MLILEEWILTRDNSSETDLSSHLTSGLFLEHMMLIFYYNS
jgi:hypothetical protein